MLYYIEILLIMPFLYCLIPCVLRFLFGYKAAKREFWTYIAFCAVTFQIVYSLLPAQENIITRSILAFIIVVTSSLHIFKAPPAKKAAAVSCSIILVILSELCSYIAIRSFAVELLQTYERSLTLRLNLIAFSAPYAVVFLVYHIIKRVRFNSKIKYNSLIIISFFTTLMLATSFIIVLEIELMSQENAFSGGLEPLLVLTVVFVLSTFITCALTIQTAAREQRKSKALLNYQHIIFDLYDSTRQFRHNYKNTLIMLTGYYREGDIEGLGRVLGEMNSEYAAVYSSEYANGIAAIGDGGLKWLVTSKLLLAQGQGINFSVQVSGQPVSSRLPMTDLIEIIGILLDNAIEAAAQSQSKLAGLVISNDGETLQISVRNTFEAAPDINKIFNKNFTTKKGHEGIGLFSVKRILSRYDFILTDVKVKDGFFIFELCI